MSEQNQYTEDNIRSLDWKHIRMRPGMYIGKLEMVLQMMVFIFWSKKFSITVSMNLHGENY
jgi:DNA gyrase/topoisomerase IV subunit B